MSLQLLRLVSGEKSNSSDVRNASRSSSRKTGMNGSSGLAGNLRYYENSESNDNCSSIPAGGYLIMIETSRLPQGKKFFLKSNNLKPGQRFSEFKEHRI